MSFWGQVSKRLRASSMAVSDLGSRNASSRCGQHNRSVLDGGIALSGVDMFGAKRPLSCRGSAQHVHIPKRSDDHR